MGSTRTRKQARLKRKKRVRKYLTGTPERPRISVFRSSRHIYAQIIDDTSGHTLISVSSLEKVVREHSSFENKIALASFVGKLLGERALGKGLNRVVFDKNGFLYHGRVKAVAEGAREAGLDF